MPSWAVVDFNGVFFDGDGAGDDGEEVEGCFDDNAGTTGERGDATTDGEDLDTAIGFNGDDWDDIAHNIYNKVRFAVAR